MMPGTSRADAPAIEEGLTPEAHIQAALLLDSPFDADPHLELDLVFALEGMARLGPSAGDFRSHVMTTMRTIKRWLAPLEKEALAARPKGVVGEMSPTFIGFFIALFSWEDRGLPMKLVSGFEVSGHLAPSNVYRQVLPKVADGRAARASLLGTEAEEFVDKLEAQSTPLAEALQISEETEKEVQHGLAGPARTRAHFDALYGRGG